MLIAHYYPGDRNSDMVEFMRYVEGHRFLHNQCTKDVDLIYCGSASQLDRAMAAKTAYEKPLICWVWDLPCFWREWIRNSEEFNEHARRDKYIEKTVSNLRKCDRVISASKYTQRILKEKYSLESEQLYFYVHPEYTNGNPQPIKKGYAIQIGRLALNKRVDHSIRATGAVGQKFICVGTGVTEGLKQLAQDIPADVEFYSNVPRPKLAELLRQAAVLLSPSLHEGWGMTPIEAIYCGTPILLSDLEVFREVYGDSALYHKKDDAEDMKGKLGRLMKDKALQRKIVEDCLPLVSDFTMPKFIKRWEKAIR